VAKLRLFSGPVALVGILLLGTEPGRRALKKMSREAAKVGVQVYDKVKEIAAEAREEAQELIEEAKSERNNGRGTKVSTKSS